MTRSTVERRPAAVLARASLLMPVLFVLVTVAFVALSDGTYVEAWVPWTALTLLWLSPWLAGLVLAVRAHAAGAGHVAGAALLVNALGLVLFGVPALVDRLATAA